MKKQSTRLTPQQIKEIKAKATIKTKYALQRKICESSYYEFFKFAWANIPEVGNEPFEDNFHIKYLCDLLQENVERVAARKPKKQDLIINIPPRTLKTNIVSAFLNAWAWAKWPHLRFICASYSQTLSEDINKRVSMIINSAWYQLLWGHVYKITLNNAGDIQNDKGGERFATSVNGSCTGKGADIFIIDDPLNPQEETSDVIRQQSIHFYTAVARSRLNNQQTGLRMLVMQRLHEEDLSGYLLAKEGKWWKHICLPATNKYPIHPAELEKYYRDGLLFPERLTKEFLAVEELNSTSPGQYGQSPRPPEGNMFKQSMFEIVPEVPSEFDYLYATSDTAYKAKTMNDYTVCAVFGVKGQDLYIIDVFRQQIQADRCEDVLRAFCGRYASRYGWRGVWIEPKGHGIYLNQRFAREHILVPGPLELERFYKDRRFDKVERANNIIVHLWNWKVKLYSELGQLNDLLGECYNFPNGKHDDFVDCLIDGIKLFKCGFFNTGTSGAVVNDLGSRFRTQDY